MPYPSATRVPFLARSSRGLLEFPNDRFEFTMPLETIVVAAFLGQITVFGAEGISGSRQFLVRIAVQSLLLLQFGPEPAPLFPLRHSTAEYHQQELSWDGTNPRGMFTTGAANSKPENCPKEGRHEFLGEQCIRHHAFNRSKNVAKGENPRHQTQHRVAVPPEPV